jgi:hypothetical protein
VREAHQVAWLRTAEELVSLVERRERHEGVDSWRVR